MNTSTDRLHSLDGLRAFALLMGVALHASMSFVPGMLPGIWAAVDNSPSPTLGAFFFVTHTFRMTLFFVIAGFFARMLYIKRGTAGFWSNRAVRIGIPLVVGWMVVYPAISAVWTAGMLQHFNGKLPPLPAAMMQRPVGWFPITHLWFLYYLVMLYAVAMLVRAVLARLDRAGIVTRAVDVSLRVLLNSGAAALLIGVPLALVLFNRPAWFAFGGVPTPDQTLIPQLAPLLAYGVAVGIGWAVHRQAGLLELLQRRWLVNAVIALLATLVAIRIAGLGLSFTVPPPAGNAKLLLALSYVAAGWGWTFALTGLALRYLKGESRARRYVADASYWIYIAHLPVVAAAQVVVAKWNLHWSLKFAFVMVASLAVLFASYHLLVRWSFIGRVLNGRTVPLFTRKGATSAVPLRPLGAGNVAELQRVSKRYGKLLALDCADMELRRGELLALLGPNGAGKSTAIGLWLGLQEADSGGVSLLGGSPLDLDYRRNVGVMMQDVGLANGMRVRELIAQTSSYYVAPYTVAQTLALARIESLADRTYDKLSGGQKRQVQFALAVCGRPQVLFLDEPSVGLDLEARAAMWETIRALLREGCSILLTTHYLEEAEALADRVIVLAQGRVVASGAVDEVRALVSRREIRCESSLSLEALRAWPGVLEASQDAQRLRLTVTDAETILRRLLAEDSGLARLEVRQAGLAEAFTQLTKEAA